MKLTHVSLLLAVLTACLDDPLAPVPRLPQIPSDDRPVVITGRVVSSKTNLGIGWVNLRVLDAKASVGTDDGGRYQIVLPARFRGQTVLVNVRAIGFKQLNRPVALTRDTVSVDVAFDEDMISLGCTMGIVVYAPSFTEPGFTVTTRSAKKVKAGK